MATVTLERLCKRYPGSAQPAVEDVDLAIADGEFMVLLGPSGCGKSTTLRMIAGLESIGSGTLEIDGRRINDVPAKDRDIAMVFQSYALYPHMNVFDNMAFGLRRRGFRGDEIDRRVRGAAETLGLSELLTRKPHALSGGQRQRVALGRAIVREPAVFLFDEPLSNLDAALRVSMRGELARLHRRLGATMIYVTHDQVEAMTMGSRICIMQGGRVVQVGAPLDIYRRPANTFVAGFLGSPPMNLLRATVATDGAGAGASASVRVGAATVPLGDALAPAARLAAGTEVVFGLRPEDIRQADSGAAHAGSSVRIAAEVTSVEPLGAETLVTLVPRGGDSEMRARLGRDTALRAGETADFALDLRAVHLFDPRTGQALYPDA